MVEQMHRHIGEHHQAGGKPQSPDHRAPPHIPAQSVACNHPCRPVTPSVVAGCGLRRSVAVPRPARTGKTGRLLRSAGMLEIRHLVKYFGPLVAVDDVSFTVPEGEVLGFLGPNGAGKSTTMKMITGFLAPTAGTAIICGHDIATAADRGETADRLSARGRAGLSGHDRRRFSRLHRPYPRLLGRPRRRARIGRIVEMIKIAEVMHQPIETLSKGYQAAGRRCAGAAARSRGADPRRADRRARPEPEIRDAQAHRGDAAREGDHHLDASARGGRGGVQPRDHHRAWPHPRRRHAGRARRALAPSQCRAPRHRRRRRPRYAGRAGARCPGVAAVEPVSDAEGGGLIVFPRDGQPIVAEIAELARERGWPITGLRVERGRLDDVFREITAAQPEPAAIASAA